MKKLILSTSQAETVSADRKEFSFYLDKPMTLNKPAKMYLQHITNETRQGNPPVYDDGLLTIGNLSIDYTTIPTSIYATWTYMTEWTLDLDDTTKCTVFNSSGGSSGGNGGELKFFTFKDYGTGGYPKTTVVGQVLNTGIGYSSGDYIIVKETAFTSGYVTGIVNMRVNITGVSTNEMLSYPKGIITGVTLNSSYIGEVGTNYNFTHSTVQNGQGTEFIWGTQPQISGQTSAIELKEIVNGGYGFSVGDIFWVNKNDALNTSSYLVPFKVEVTSVSNTVTPALTDYAVFYTIRMRNVLDRKDNITDSGKKDAVLVYNHQRTAHHEPVAVKDYFITDLLPQNIMGISLLFESDASSGLSQYSDYLISLRIIS